MGKFRLTHCERAIMKSNLWGPHNRQSNVRDGVLSENSRQRALKGSERFRKVLVSFLMGFYANRGGVFPYELTARARPARPLWVGARRYADGPPARGRGGHARAAMLVAGREPASPLPSHDPSL